MGPSHHHKAGLLGTAGNRNSSIRFVRAVTQRRTCVHRQIVSARRKFIVGRSGKKLEITARGNELHRVQHKTLACHYRIITVPPREAHFNKIISACLARGVTFSNLLQRTPCVVPVAIIENLIELKL